MVSLNLSSERRVRGGFLCSGLWALLLRGMRSRLNGMWHAHRWGVRGWCWCFHGEVGRCKFLFQGTRCFLLVESSRAGGSGRHTFLLGPGHDWIPGLCTPPAAEHLQGLLSYKSCLAERAPGDADSVGQLHLMWPGGDPGHPAICLPIVLPSACPVSPLPHLLYTLRRRESTQQIFVE